MTRVMLRDDARLASSYKNSWAGVVLDQHRLANFVNGLRDLIARYTGSSVDVVNVKDQLQSTAHEIHLRNPDMLVSYDVWLSAVADDMLPGLPRIDLHTSRQFDINTAQVHGTQSVIRPEKNPWRIDTEEHHITIEVLLREDLEDATNILLVDDDSVTGRLFNLATEKIRRYNAEAAISTLTMASLSPVKYDDVVDARDFIFGSYAGGLVCVDPCTNASELMRVPYLAPYVNLNTRMLLTNDPDEQRDFSHEVVKLNQELYANTRLFVGQMAPAFQKFALGYLNLNPNVGIQTTTTMEEFCSRLHYHINQ